MNKDENVAKERAWNNARLQNDPDWFRYGFTRRAYATEGRSFVQWAYVDGQPQVREIFTCTGYHINGHTGLSIWLKRSHTTQESFKVGSLPTQYTEGAFLWVPAFSDVRYVPRDHQDPLSPRKLSTPICFKTAFRPEAILVEGAVYILELAEFRTRWPEYQF